MINSVGMEMADVPAGRFLMGSWADNWDTRPLHSVTLTQPFRIAVRPVIHAQYERFDPAHRAARGAAGDEDPVTFVSWDEAAAYCRWLSQSEGKHYRLPTEAEWEYVCKTQPNLLERSDRVENWCADWYGPYPAARRDDPAGCVGGDARITRGGPWGAWPSHPSPTRRLGGLPGDRHDALGFRVVLGEPSPHPSWTAPPSRLWARDVRQGTRDWTPPVDRDVPFFAEPIPYVHLPPDADGPLYARHNHDPGLTYCDNGDLLAIWYTTRTEEGRELAIAAARLRRGRDAWDAADLFWDTPGRNDHAPTVWADGRGTLFHFNGLAAGGGWDDLALIQRVSRDNGATWSPARIIAPERRHGRQPVSSVFGTRDGAICLPCDAVPGPEGGTVLHVSRDGGAAWEMPGGRIAGIHAGVDQWTDGRLVAVGRGSALDGRMPMSVSYDGGATWTYSPTPFPPIGGGQRAVLRRLRENILLLVSFTSGSPFPDAAGNEFEGRGMFAALSEDGGVTWPVRKVMTDGRCRRLQGRGWTGEFEMDAAHAEPKGYLAAVQTPNGLIHLVSSGIYYRFNLAWLRQPNGAVSAARH